MKTIKQSVINTFDRVGIDYKKLLEDPNQYFCENWITGEGVDTSRLVLECVKWVYNQQKDYDFYGSMKVKIADFDRIRYFIAEQDPEAYQTCID